MSQHLGERRQGPMTGGAQRACVAALTSLMVLLALGRSALAATNPWAQLASPTFDRIAQDTALPNSALLTAIATDGQGFVWVGTQNGLARWDGHDFKTHVARTGARGEAPGGQIQVLHTDKAGRLWIGAASSGLARYDPGKDQFIALPASAGLVSANVKALANDGDGGLWVGADVGLVHLVRTGDTLRRAGRTLAPGGVQALAATPGGLWVATSHGLYRMSATGGLVAVALPARGAGVSTLAAGSDGRLWVGTERHGAFVFDPRRDQWRSVNGSRPRQKTAAGRIDSIEQISPGEVWIGTFAEGLLRVDAQSLEARRLPVRGDQATSLADHNIRALHRSPSGMVFVATARAFSLYDPRQLAVATIYPASPPLPGLAEENIFSALSARDGRVWLGGAIEGVEIFSSNGGGSQRLATTGPSARLPRASVRALADLPDGDVLIGTDEGLLRASLDAKRIGVVHIAGREARQRVQALAASGQRIWIGASDGVWEIQSTSRSTARTIRVLRAPDLTDAGVNALLADRAGRLWIGTRNGLNRYDPTSGRIERFLARPKDRLGLPTNFISALFADRQGRVWIGTFGGGLAVIDDPDRDVQRIRRIGTADGLPNTNVNSILQDGAGAIWVSTDNGLARIDAAGQRVIGLQAPDGVKIPTYWLGAGARTRQGQLLFGGAGGLTVVDPARFALRAERAPVRVTAVRFAGQNAAPGGLNAGEPLKPPLGVRNIAIDFAALDYRAPGRIAYAYRLKGVDRQWIATSAERRTAAYTNLAPRAYVLEIRATYPDGAWRGDVLRLPVEISPRWWETIWARGAAMALALGLLVAAVGGWTARLRRRKAQLERLVAERTAALEVRTGQLETQAIELQAARARAEALASAKTDFLSTMSHEIRTPMTGILGLNALLLKTALAPTQRTFAEAVELSATNLLVVINDILDASKLEAGKVALEDAPFSLEGLGEDAVELLAPKAFEKGLNLTCLVSPSARGWFQGDAVRLRQILLNLLSNAVKFTETGEVKLLLSAGPGMTPSGAVRIEVVDTGIGLDSDAKARLFQKFEQADSTIARRFGGTGLGLSICRDIVTLMGGDMGVGDNPDGGSVFWVETPLRPTAAPPTTDQGLQGLRVLAVDASPSSLEALELQLAFEGAALTSVPDLADGLSVAQDAVAAKAPFHAILVDAAALQGDASSLRERVKREGLDAAVIVMAPLNQMLEDPAVEAFDGLVAKPVRRRALTEALDRARLTSQTPTTEHGPLGLERPARVLLAEDNAVNRLLVGTLVEAMGCDLSCVEDGQAALDACRDQAFYLILMDVNMPLMNGLETARRIRGGAGPCRIIPILALTANASDDDRAACLAAGMSDVITKPIDVDQFARTLSSWLAADPPVDDELGQGVGEPVLSA